MKFNQQKLLAQHMKMILKMMDDLGITHVNKFKDQRWFDLYQKVGNLWYEYGELCQHPKYNKKPADENHNKPYQVCAVCGLIKRTQDLDK